MDDRDELLRQYLSTKYLTTPPEEVNPSTGASATSTSDSPSPEAPEEESTPGNDKAEAVKADGYANAADDSGVKAAQANRDRADLISNVGRSLSNIFTARAQANGYKPDDTVYNSIAQQGQQGVTDAQTARQNAIQAYLEKNRLSQQALANKYAANAETRAQGEYERKPIEAQKERDFKDRELGVRIDAQTQSHQDTIASREQMARDAAANRAAVFNGTREAQDARKTKHENIEFTKGFGAAEDKHAAAVGKIDETINMLSQPGVAQKLVPLDVAKGIAGRLNPQEIAAASGDPTIAGKLQDFIGMASSGQMGPKSTQEFLTLLNSQKNQLEKVRAVSREAAINRYADASGQSPADVRRMVHLPDAAPTQLTTTSSPGAAGGGYPKTVRNGTKTAVVKDANEEKEAAAEGFQ